MESNGPFFQATLKALRLEAGERADAIRNATEIVNKVIQAYAGSAVDKIDPSKAPSSFTTGLVYGRIQSGKTRAMIASTAMAFDNDFRISVVLTSNINDLVNQTHGDFRAGVPGQIMFTKDDDLEKEVQAVRHIQKTFCTAQAN